MPLSVQQAAVVVLGAGAAGMMCAFEAGRRGRRVILLDHADGPGRKILISGGGRCNFTNTATRAENFLSENAHFARSALAAFTPSEMVALVEKHGIRYHEKTLGQLFCDDSARRIVALLEKECAESGVELRCGVRVTGVRREDAGAGSEGRLSSRFIVESSAGSIACQTLVVATGGLSIPKMGATGVGYDIARGFGHRIVAPRPALVPFTFGAGELGDWSDLAGVSTEVLIGVVPTATAQQPGAKGNSATGRRGGRRYADSPSFREKLLITHRGISGPAVLQASSYWQPGFEVSVDLAPGEEVISPLKARVAGRDSRAMLAAVKQVMPTRLAERWMDLHLRDGADWSNAGLDRSEAALHAWTLQPSGTEGFAKAEVTAGGVATDELKAQNLESRRVPGLHFVGEVVDVTGWLGGYNFQWAWASAVACGRSL